MQQLNNSFINTDQYNSQKMVHIQMGDIQRNKIIYQFSFNECN